MDRVENTTLDTRLPVADLQNLFREQQVRLAICFGSVAGGKEHVRSDIDLAVEFEELRPGDDGYNDRFFELYRTVSETLGTDDVDLLDVHSLSDSLARTVLSDGVLVHGDLDRVETVRKRFTDHEETAPDERLDSAIERIDEYFA